MLHKYVPTVDFTTTEIVPDSGEAIQVQHAVFQPVNFGGDQLTAVRGRGAKRIRSNSLSPQARLEGLIPCAEDWHTKLNLLGVINNDNYYFLLLYPHTGDLEVFLFYEFGWRARNPLSAT